MHEYSEACGFDCIVAILHGKPNGEKPAAGAATDLHSCGRSQRLTLWQVVRLAIEEARVQSVDGG